MFDGIAKRYDLLNRLISLGVDQGWRKKTVGSLELGPGAHVLDLATGTADLAILIARTHIDCTVTGVDPSSKMLEVGAAKLVKSGLDQRVVLKQGIAEELPFDDDTFSGVTIAFGIRNVPDRERALSEMARVTRPGGKVAILELSEPKSGIMSHAARFHMHRVVPFLGSLISGAKEYRYLPRSIAAFPEPSVFAHMMEHAGLSVTAVTPLTLGVCHLYVGTVPEPHGPSEGAA